MAYGSEARIFDDLAIYLLSPLSFAAASPRTYYPLYLSRWGRAPGIDCFLSPPEHFTRMLDPRPFQRRLWPGPEQRLDKAGQTVPKMGGGAGPFCQSRIAMRGGSRPYAWSGCCQLSRAGRLERSGEVSRTRQHRRWRCHFQLHCMHGRAAAAHVQQIDGCTKAGQKRGEINRRGGLHLDMSYPRGETVFTIVAQKSPTASMNQAPPLPCACKACMCSVVWPCMHACMYACRCAAVPA